MKQPRLMNTYNKLYIFNPDHDMALANYDVNYMPPIAARQLATDLALLPAWYAGKDNAVLAPSSYNLSFLKEMSVLFPQLSHLVTELNEDIIQDITPVPWGWNPSIYKRLSLLGIGTDKMPSIDQLNLIREKSHRQLAVKLLKELQINNLCCGESFYFTHIEEIKKFVEDAPACVLKAPLSGSGKGLNWCKGIFTSHIMNWCKNIIKQQGGVVAEPLYEKNMDFAMQFYADCSGKVTFSGYSVFQTNATGAYGGNILDNNPEIEQRITEYIPLQTLRTIREELEQKLAHSLKGVYNGYLGVDMMVCQFNESPLYRIHPCVEVNLRMTMGMVARKIYDTFVSPSASGIYRVDNFASPEEVKAQNYRMHEEHPLIVQNHRIVSGYLPLVPVTPVSKYLAWLLI